MGDSRVHRHFAALAVSAPHDLVVRDGRGVPTLGRRILIEPLAPHRVVEGVHAQLLFVEPTARGPALAGLSLAAGADPVLAEGASRAFWLGRGDPGSTPGDGIDDRVRVVLGELDALLARGPVRLDSVARLAHLSPDRLRHLFAEQVGIPFRRYLLWRRLGTATHAIHVGLGVSEASARAGFADAAHLARVVRTTFGIQASQLLGSTTDQPLAAGSAPVPASPPASPPANPPAS